MHLNGSEGFLSVLALLPLFPLTWLVVGLMWMCLVVLRKNQAAKKFLFGFFIWLVISIFVVLSR